MSDRYFILIAVPITLVAVVFMLLQWRKWGGEERQVLEEVARRLGGMVPRPGLWTRLNGRLEAVIMRGEARLSLQSQAAGEASPSATFLGLRFPPLPSAPARLRCRFRGSAARRGPRSDLIYRPLFPGETMQLHRTGNPEFDERIVAYCTSEAAFARMVTPEVQRQMLRLDACLHQLDAGLPTGGAWDVDLQWRKRSLKLRLTIIPRRLPPADLVAVFCKQATALRQALEAVGAPGGRTVTPAPPS